MTLSQVTLLICVTADHAMSLNMCVKLDALQCQLLVFRPLAAILWNRINIIIYLFIKPRCQMTNSLWQLISRPLNQVSLPITVSPE